MPDPSDDEFFDRAYAILGAVEDAPVRRRGRVFGVAELVRYAHDPDMELTIEETNLLVTDRHLSAIYRDLRRRLRVVDVPNVAAASDGDLERRSFPGGTIDVFETVRAGQWRMVVTFDLSLPPATWPKQLVLELGDDFAKLAIPEVDEFSGETMLLLDETRPRDAKILALLRDPRSHGEFL